MGYLIGPPLPVSGWTGVEVRFLQTVLYTRRTVESSGGRRAGPDDELLDGRRNTTSDEARSWLRRRTGGRGRLVVVSELVLPLHRALDLCLSGVNHRRPEGSGAASRTRGFRVLRSAIAQDNVLRERVTRPALL
jgi:hypothetical protein